MLKKLYVLRIISNFFQRRVRITLKAKAHYILSEFLQNVITGEYYKRVDDVLPVFVHHFKLLIGFSMK